MNIVIHQLIACPFQGWNWKKEVPVWKLVPFPLSLLPFFPYFLFLSLPFPRVPYISGGCLPQIQLRSLYCRSAVSSQAGPGRVRPTKFLVHSPS